MTGFTVVSKIVEKIITELAKKLASRLAHYVPGKRNMCKELLGLYVVLGDLVREAALTYELFLAYTQTKKESALDEELRQGLRLQIKELLSALKRFERHLKAVYQRLQLLDGSTLSIKLVSIPESSYSLFKQYFTEDLAPKFVADRSAGKYILRIPVKKTKHAMVSVNKVGDISLNLERLFHDGHIDYVLLNVDDEKKLAKVIKTASADLVTLQRVQASLGSLIRSHCDLRAIL